MYVFQVQFGILSLLLLLCSLNCLSLNDTFILFYEAAHYYSAVCSLTYNYYIYCCMIIIYILIYLYILLVPLDYMHMYKLSVKFITRYITRYIN